MDIFIKQISRRVFVLLPFFGVLGCLSLYFIDFALIFTIFGAKETTNF